MTKPLEALTPAGKFMLEPCESRWHHIKHGEAQVTEPRFPMHKLYSEETVNALIAALEQSHRHISRQEEIMSNQNQRIAELESSQLAVKLPAVVNFDDMDASSHDREVIEAIAECKGWNAAITAARIMNDAGGAVIAWKIIHA